MAYYYPASTVRLSLLALILSSFVPRLVQAATWTYLSGGNATGSWNIASNWSGGVPNARGAVADFSTLNLTANSTVTLASAVTVGSLAFADTTASNTWTLTGSTLTLAASSGTPSIAVTNQTATLGSVLVGAAGFTKTGSGTLTLSGGASNALTGAIAVNAGTLSIADGYSHVGLTGVVTVASGATFNFNQNFISANLLTNSLSITGTGYGGTYGALHLTGNATASGPITLTGNTTITHDNNNATLSNTISGSGYNLQLTTLTAGQPGLAINGSIQTGTGSLSVTGAANTKGSSTTSVTTYSVKLGGANTFTGGVTINNGTLLLVNAGALNATAGSENAVTFGSGTTTGNLTLGGNSVVVANLTSNATTAGSPVVQNAATTAATLTVGNAQNLGGTFAGVIQDGLPSTGTATALSLKKAGTGTLVLSGANTYSGSTSLAGGTLSITSESSLGTSGLISFDGGILKYAYAAKTDTLSNRFSTAAGQYYKIDTNGNNLTYGTALSSSGGKLYKTGAGTLTLSVGTGGTATTLTGGMTVDAGRLAISDGYSHVNSTGLVTVASGASFLFSQNFISANPFTHALSLSGDGDGSYGALELTGNATVSGPLTLAADAIISHGYNTATISGPITGTDKNLTLASTISGQAALVVSGNISLGTGVLTKTGANAVKLSGTNSYGSAVVSEGLLNFTTAAALGGSGANITVGDSGVVVYSGSTDPTALLARINPASTGMLALNGGTVTSLPDLSGYPSLGLGAYAATTVTGTVTPSGGYYRLGGGGATLTINSALTGSSGLIVNGGTVVLGGAHSFTGATTVNGGTLQVDGVLSGAVTVASGGTLAPGPASGTGSLTLSSPLTVAGTLTMNLDRSAAQTADLLTAPSIALSGTLTVTNSGVALQLGDRFKLFNVRGSFTQSSAGLTLPTLASGLMWDYSGLLSTGVIKVVAFTPTVGDPSWPHLLYDQIVAAKAAGYSNVTVTPGTYEMPDRLSYQSSFGFSGWTDFTLDASGVTFVVGKQRAFTLSGCTHVTVKGCTIRARYPSFTQGKILSKGTSSGTAYAIWQISDGYPTSLNAANGYWFNAVSQSTGNIDLSTGDAYNCTVTPQADGTYKVLFTGKSSVSCAVGDWLVSRLPTADAQSSAVYLSSSSNCTIQSVTSQSGGFATFFEDSGGGNKILDCRIECSPVAPTGCTVLPVVSCAADGLHSRRSYPGPDIERLVTSGALLDDCIAIHGFYYPVTAYSGNTITVTASGGGEFEVGAEVRIVDDSGTYASANCTAITVNKASTDSYFITLDSAPSIPSTHGTLYADTPKYNGSGFKIIDCSVGNTRSRAIITKGDNGLISGTTIKHADIAINIGPELTSQWQESGYSKNVAVIGNAITDCCNGVNLVSLGAYENENLTFSNNVFGTMATGDAIALNGCRSVTVAGNYFDKLTNGYGVSLKQVTGVTFANNLVEYSASANSSVYKNGSLVYGLTGTSNGLIYTGRNYKLTNSASGYLLQPMNFEWQAGGYHQVLSATTGLALGVNGSTASDTALVMETATGADSQLWCLQPTSGTADTTFTLVNKLSGLTATVSSGQLIQQAAVSGATSQIWTPSVASSYVYSTWATSTGASTTQTADDDGDGLSNLMEYALATDPLKTNTGPAVGTRSLTVNGTTANYLTLTFNRRVAATDITLAVQYSSDLFTWASTAVLVTSVPSSDGTTSEIWRAPTPLGTAARDFLRVRVTAP